MSLAERIDAPEAGASELIAAALAYAGRGLPVFPCHPETKQPLTSHGLKDASADESKVRAWWTRHPNAMIGVPTGQASRSWVLDVDDPAVFEQACPFEIPATRRCETGKGYHLYFKHDPAREVRNTQRQRKTEGGDRPWPLPELPGAEVRGEGGYVIVPPSMHPSGRRYAWASDTAAVEAPAELLAIVRREGRFTKAVNGGASPSGPGTDTAYGLAALDAECRLIRAAGNGEQEGTLSGAAFNMGELVEGGHLSHGTARARLIGAGLEMPSYNARDPWTLEAIAEKVDRRLAAGAESPRGPSERTIKRDGSAAFARSREGAEEDAEQGEAASEQSQEAGQQSASSRPGVRLEDFHAYMPAHNYIFAPSGEPWPAASVNSRIPPIPLFDRQGEPVLDDKQKQVKLNANLWLDQNRPVEQMTWAPGEDQVVRGRLISEGGWMQRPGCSVFNLYRPPAQLNGGDGSKATPWLDHIRRIYPEDAEHIVHWLAHRIQRPQEKINHALVLGGNQGIGKDTFLEPVKAGIGPWNFSEVRPEHLMARFNGFVKSVILRVSEARDLGDVDRFAFYDHMKIYTAAPPDVLRVDEKHLREYSVFNVCGVIITTNHKTDGIYLPADDRRHYVAWSNSERESFDENYWNDLYGWYADAGTSHVCAYLASLDLSGFNPKAPPPKTPAFWDIVSSNQAPEEAELADALEMLAWPHAVTIAQIANAASQEFGGWLLDRKNSRAIPHKLNIAGYVAVRSDTQDGLWRVGMRRCTIYAKRSLDRRDALIAAQRLVAGQ